MPLRPAQSFNLIVASIGLALASETALLWHLSRNPPVPASVSAPAPAPRPALPTPAPPMFTVPGLEDEPTAPKLQSNAPTRGAKLSPTPPLSPAPLSPAPLSPAPLSPAARDEAKTLFETATAALARKDNQVALENFRKVVEIAPNHLPTRLNLALIYLGANRPAQAAVQLEKATQLDPQSAASRFELARTYLKLKQPKKALKPLQEAVRLAPKEREARVLLAGIYLSQKRPREALSQWSAAAQNDARDVEAHLQAAQLAASLNQPAQAEKWLRRALVGAPRDPQPALVLARVLMSKRQPREAEKVLLKATKTRPDVFELYPPLADARLAIRDLSGAKSAVQSALLRLPAGKTDADKAQIAIVEGTLQMTLGRIWGQQKQPEQARIAFARAVKLLPRAAEPKSLLALADLQSGRRAAGIAALEGALALDPKRAGDRLSLAQVLARDKKWDAARLQYAAYAQLQPRDAGALLQWAQVAGAAKRPDEELEVWNKLVALQPKNPAPLLQRGVLLKTLKRPTDALASFQNALKLAGNDANILFEIARLQTEARQFQNAANTWKQVIAARPDFVPAYASFLQNSARSGQGSGARLFLARQLATGREDPRVISEILRFYQQNKQDAAAQALLSDVVKRNPKARLAQAALRSFGTAMAPISTPIPAPSTSPAAPSGGAANAAPGQ